MTLPSFLGLASFSIGARSVPVIASVVLHASLAAGLVATAAGHARPGAARASAELTVDVETLETRETIEPTPVVPVAVPTPPAQAANDQPPPTHTHPYPVDPSHDAHPHDPSLHHDEASPHEPDHDHDHDSPASSAAEPAAAAPALVAPGAALPRFDLSSGSGAPAGIRVAGSGTGSGAQSGTGGFGAAASDEVVHAASSVQVAARLVQSVVAAYPVHARADEVEGDVSVEIVVDREGRVIDARVTRPAGHGFDDAALVAVRAYRFSPAQREGRAVRVRMPWSVQFRLR